MLGVEVMNYKSYKLGAGAIDALNRLMPRVQKGNQAAAAVTFAGNTPVLRRGRGAGKLIRLDVELWIRQNTARSLSFHWPNEDETQPLLLAFSLRECVDGLNAVKSEDLVIFAPDCEDSEQVQTLFITGDRDVQAHGYVYAVEEGLDGSRIAWFVFVNQTEAGNHTLTRFGSPEALASLTELVSRGMKQYEAVFPVEGGALCEV